MLQQNANSKNGHKKKLLNVIIVGRRLVGVKM